MIYLDNCSTTRVLPEIFEAMRPYFQDEYANPESKYYSLAEHAKRAVRESREKVASLLGCESKNIIFTSGATEANNTILKGIAQASSKKGNHIITTAVEHASVFETCKFLETQGYEVTYLGVDKDFQIDFSEFENSIREDTILVSIMWVNNEVGGIFPIERIAQICRAHNVLFHTDATQAYGKVEVDLRKTPGIDFLTLSGHKIYGPKGVGILYHGNDEHGIPYRITPLLHGGDQEDSLRSGTHNVPAIVGMTMAMSICTENLYRNYDKVLHENQKLSIWLKEQFGENCEIINSFTSVPHIISTKIRGVNNQILLKNISDVIGASSGSACSNSKPSRVLKSMGFSEKEVSETVRFCLSPYDDYSLLYNET